MAKKVFIPIKVMYRSKVDGELYSLEDAIGIWCDDWNGNAIGGGECQFKDIFEAVVME